VIDDVLEGQGMVVDSPVIPGTWAYSSQASDYAYDLDQANELLDSVGWEQAADDGVRTKDGQRLAFNLIASNDSERAQTAQLLSDQWASVGITVTVETVSPLELRDALESRQFDAILAHLRLPGDPDPYPFWHETQIDKGQNYAGLDHRRISEVIEQARVTVNQRRRYELYEEFQQLFAEQMPSLLLYVPVYTYGVGGRVNDVQIGPLMYPADRFRTISDWWIVHRRVFVSEAEAVGLDND
jgi:peptide/nickel transport system substrate-binding protein